jgi:ABC-type uncharacterized transport system fused permease/ATPase subunit
MRAGSEAIQSIKPSLNDPKWCRRCSKPVAIAPGAGRFFVSQLAVLRASRNDGSVGDVAASLSRVINCVTPLSSLRATVREAGR